MPKSRQRWVTRASISTKEPASSSSSIALAGGELARRVLLVDARPRRLRSSAAASRRLSSSMFALAWRHREQHLDRHSDRPGPRPRQRTRENPRRMPFSELDTAAVARTLSQIAEQPDDVVDAFFERREEVELPPEGEAGGLRRLARGGLRRAPGARAAAPGSRRATPSRPAPFAEALRQVARAICRRPPTPSRRWRWRPAGAGRRPPELLDFPGALSRAVRAHHVGFPLRLDRAPAPALGAGGGAAPGARAGERDLLQLRGRVVLGAPRRPPRRACDAAAAARRRPAPWWRCSAPARRRPPAAVPRAPPCWRPAAVAVLLHEAVAHALEADTLAQGGNPEAGGGRRHGRRRASTCWTIPRRRPRRCAGPPTTRARPSSAAGCCAAASSSSRSPTRCGPAPRRCCCPAPAGAAPAICRRAALDPPRAPARPDRPRPTCSPARRGAGSTCPRRAAARSTRSRASSRSISPTPGASARGALAETVGPCVLRGRVADLLTRVAAVGSEARPAGAGWCAKGGQKLPVWATAPALRLEGVEVLT